MIKNKEWLKAEIKEAIEIELSHDFGLKSGKYISLYTLEKLIDQLEEPGQVVPSKMETTTPKQDDEIWFEEMAKELGVKFTVKEVVPFWFDDWYEEIKRFYPDEKIQKAVAIKIINQAGNGHHFENQFGEKIENDSVDVFHEIHNNREKYTRAILDGYTIEQPKLLTVIVKDGNTTTFDKQLPEDEVNKMMEGME